ncbi:DUF1289 domain-containing protein [Rhodocyclus purpureus]|uniref:DUF1289 domain-containing protein n=1 Tax=Rhodocyclus purpureus TaxID=1067 RepID=UPI001F5DA9BD|nr:DUF1289 domain-containing protein [Rhodocyclus purpureus]
MTAKKKTNMNEHAASRPIPRPPAAAASSHAHHGVQEKTHQAPPSPCSGVCRMDPETQQCRGCLRSLAEIAGWSRFSDDEKWAVLASLSGRKEQPA